MGVAPAEPLCYRATELAFVFYEVHAVRLTILDASTDTYSRAFSANQFLFLEVLVVVLGCLAILHSSEVRLIAFKTLVI